MISNLDETLKQLLVQRMPLDPAEVDVAFELPERQWAAGLTKPTLNLYLYDIRENQDLRENDWVVERHGREGARRRKPARVDLSYMVTAWTQAVEDQHKLLWHALAALLRHPVLPLDLLQGELRGMVERLGLEVRLSAGQPEGVLKSPADYWSALSNELRPGINCLVTLPMDLETALVTPLVLTKVLRFRQQSQSTLEELVQVAGVVREMGESKKPIAFATVSVQGRGLATETDGDGRYSLRDLPRGRYTLTVKSRGQPERQVTISVPGVSYDLEV
ncbi:MAG: Pvc16 family protein [Dehalococcoidia bacterium]|nr:Pvc16 family protein [Dehalococcoidia bacterium]